MRILTVVLAMMVGPFAASLAAQDRSSPKLTFEARAGLTNPTRDLGRTEVLSQRSAGLGYVVFEEAEVAPVFGAAVTANVSGPFRVRLLTEYGFQREVGGQWFCDALLPCPAVLQLVQGRMRHWSIGGDVQMRLPAVAWDIEPTAFVGVMRRSHRIRWDVPIIEVPIPTAYDHADVYLRPGVGLAKTFGSFAIFVEADAQVGGFGQELPLFIEGTNPVDNDSVPTTQVDFGFTLGARVTLW